MTLFLLQKFYSVEVEETSGSNTDTPTHFKKAKNWHNNFMQRAPNFSSRE